ncbi:MAG: hypothetical protein Q8772_02840, partial [Candidatus Phytoplasma australasiaticum]|nr:hypothetical protein [Candidatus Phytoplasma australasiaticum]
KADVDYEVVIKFNELIKQQTLNMEILKGLTPQQQVIKIIQNTYYLSVSIDRLYIEQIVYLL